MSFKRKDATDVVDLPTVIDMFKAMPETELEAVVRGITPGEFKTILKFFNDNPAYTVIANKTRLDVAVVHGRRRIRITMSDDRTIERFVGYGEAPTSRFATVIQKTLLNQVDFPGEGFRVNLKEEKPMPGADVGTLLRGTGQVPAPKHTHRFIRRFSAASADGVHRFDLSAVKTCITSARVLKTVPDSEFEEAFEVEVECIDRTKSAKAIEESMRKCVALIKSIAVDRRTENTYERELCALVGSRPPWRGVGPDLLTLNKLNMLAPDDGIVSVKNGDYVVSEKADGQRATLFVDAQGTALIVFPTGNISQIGRCATIRSSVLDCELVLGNQVLVFDAYYVDGASVAARPLLADAEGGEDRVAIIHRVIGDLELSDPYLVSMKGYRPEADACSLLEDSRLGRLGNYGVDGLVYMPKSLAVGAQYVGGPPVLTKGRWDFAFKWKPAHQNTIDFRVGLDRATGAALLYIGYNTSLDPVRPLDYLRGKPRPKNKYVEKLFSGQQECMLKADEAGRFLTLEGQVIEDGAVVEFLFNPETQSFEPLRTRPDKTKGNDYVTVHNIWNNIFDPVTEAMVCGSEAVIEITTDSDDSRYSKRSLSRSQLGTSHMNHYHNWIKDRLIGAAAAASKKEGGGVKLLDLACGKGGDISKWDANKIDVVVGIDGSHDSIVNGTDGVYARMYKYGFQGRPYVFAAYDLSRPLTLEKFREYAQEDAEMASVLEALWTPSRSVDIGKGRNGLAHDGFDVVSCMFALHYFFKEPRMLQTFLDNVSDNLRPGGIFVGCCFDGPTVRGALKAAKEHRLVGQTDGGRVAWVIDSTPTTFEPTGLRTKKAREEAKYGREIRVYIDAINHKIAEYLVDFDFLQDQLKKRGLVLVAEPVLGVAGTGLFSEMLNKYKGAAMTEAEATYSSFNRWFMFVKS
jgi:SAM-dependent methyltransferase